MRNKRNIFCLVSLHKWVMEYDAPADTHKRTCIHCNKVQFSKIVGVDVKWQDKYTKRNTYSKDFIS